MKNCSKYYQEYDDGCYIGKCKLDDQDCRRVSSCSEYIKSRKNRTDFSSSSRRSSESRVEYELDDGWQRVWPRGFRK